LEKPRDDSYGLPMVVRADGRLHIQDGHHRLAKQLYDGDTEAKVRLVDLDAISQESPASKPTPARDEDPQRGLADLLAPVGKSRMVGEHETGDAVADGVSKFINPEGSTRYVYSEGGKPLSVLQVMSRDGKSGHATNVYTLPAARRRGLASKLNEAAKQDYKDLQYSDDRSKDGEAWIGAISGEIT